MQTVPQINPKLTRLERETTIVFNEQDTDATLWTASLVEVRRWAKLGLAVTPESHGWRASLPKRLIRLRSPLKTKTLTAEHKAALLQGRQLRKAAESIANNASDPQAV